MSACPRCRRPLPRRVACPCAYRPRLTEVCTLLPNGPAAWLLVALAVPLAAWLSWHAWWNDARATLTGLLAAFAVGLPLLLQLLPTGRARGGCFLGLWLWVALALGAGVTDRQLAGTLPSWKKSGPEWFEPRLPLACSGVQLGDDFSAGPVQECGSELFQSGDVVYRRTYVQRAVAFALLMMCAPVPCPLYEGEAIRVSGSTLAQDGVVLLAAGDPQQRLVQLFGDDLAVVHQVGPACVLATCANGRVDRIVLAESPALVSSLSGPP